MKKATPPAGTSRPVVPPAGVRLSEPVRVWLERGAPDARGELSQHLSDAATFARVHGVEWTERAPEASAMHEDESPDDADAVGRRPGYSVDGKARGPGRRA
jgi:hypothetical protein